ncbi:MAG: 2-oxoglutarate ferredoxin oxidoreductase subunit alpha [Candidatus Peribacteria bacterium]|nr:2-oxoglutarate ferredoxin oxidoreductase subunit alpha [Candidatus Peribacteria bacterium]
MSRVSLKIVGASGQGINSVGEILAKGLKRAGYCVFGYREYPSLIKGGHASYQLDIESAHAIESSELQVHALITLNHHGLELNLQDLKENGIVVHQTPNWLLKPEEAALVRQRNIKLIELPVDSILARLGAKPILGNVLIAAYMWAVLGQDKELLKTMVGERFAKKKDLLELNMQCIEEGFAYADPAHGKLSIAVPEPRDIWKDHLLLRGSEAMGMGAVHAGVRLYAGYPMTPSSPLLTYIADVQNKTGMVIKQAEDEITAAQMVSGAMFMGTRALTATSGGGFDLMSETLSLNGITENPTVFVLAQRPGPATGLPTWTAQGDLMLAVHTAHGEFPRCVVSTSNAQDSFELMPIAFNIAEEFQMSVIVMTDKQIAEALYTQAPFDQEKTQVLRGSRLASEDQLPALKPTDRYDASAVDGVSLRWLPGQKAATFAGQGDEHTAAGSVDESAHNAVSQMEKRMRKHEALKATLPEPDIYGDADPNAPIDIVLVGWGSTKSVIIDVLRDPLFAGKRIDYVHYTYLWPLKTELLEKLAASGRKVLLIEGNFQAQLGKLIMQECGLKIPHHIVKYDGRPFFYDELRDALRTVITSDASSSRTVLETPVTHHP